MSYTADLPVVDHTMIASGEWLWLRARFRVTPTKISDQASVLHPNRFGIFGLRVWRQTWPNLVDEFVESSLDILGRDIGNKLHLYFKRAAFLTLNSHGQLQGRASNGNPVDLSSGNLRSYIHNKKINPALTKEFADYIITSLTEVLIALPKGSRLVPDGIAHNVYQRPGPYAPHLDREAHLLWALTDPGTPYGKFRTQKADLTIHGPFVRHDNSRAPLRGNDLDTRLCLGFTVMLRPGLRHRIARFCGLE